MTTRIYASSNQDYQTQRERSGDSSRRRNFDQLNETLFAAPPDPTYTLHPDTSPEAIAGDQRAAVREAVRRLRAAGVPRSVAAVADAADLPVWVAMRRMKEAGVPVRGPLPETAKEARRNITEKEKVYYLPFAVNVAAHLRAAGPRTATTAAHDLKLAPSLVQRAIQYHPGLFRLAGYASTGRRPARVWAAQKEASR